MKQNNRDCKIVQDLLPNYIENLTDKVTNEYIEEHIAKCPECAQALKDMNGEIKLEQIHQDKEIKYLKGIRKRVIRTIAIVSLLIMIVAACVVGYVYKKSQIQVNNYTFLKASYIKRNQEASITGEVYGSMMAVFDEKDVCISVRIVERGYTDEQMQIEKDRAKENEPYHYLNLEIINGEIHYNVNLWNGLSKKEIYNIWESSYEGIELEEI